MWLFGNRALDDLFGGIFVMNDIETQADTLKTYWKHGKVKEYYELLNQLKQCGYRVYRNDDGEHIIKKC